MKDEKKTRIFGKNLFWILPLSFLAGVTNGILGAGGGILLVFMLSFLLREREDGARAAFALSCTAVLAFSTISAVSYSVKRTFSFEDAVPYLLPALIGGVLGALFLRTIRIRWLQRIFAVFLIIGGIRMLG